MKIWMFVFLCIFPWTAFAAEDINRRDGFLAIWDSIHRPASVQLYPEFEDVQKEDRGFTEISYAAERNLLDDAQFFYPEDALTKEDAVFWIFRTGNISDLDGMERADFPRLLQRYPVITEEEQSELVGSAENLQALIQKFTTLRYDEIHEVSYYAEYFQGAGTAFGEKFDMYALTAAHRTFPYNTLVKVTNLNNDKSVVVRINDRGPYVDGRSMDLSLAAMETIGSRSQGVLRRVRLERLGNADLLDRGEETEEDIGELPPEIVCPNMPKRRYQKRITRDVRFHRGVPHTLILGDKLVLGSTRFFVVRFVRYPDGTVARIQDWVSPKERYSFTPSIEGAYTFYVGTGFGRGREMVMNVRGC